VQTNYYQNLSPEVDHGRWRVLPSIETTQATMQALERRGIHPELVPNGPSALSKLAGMIPAGADVMTAGSRTLEEIGLTDLLKSDEQRWHSLKAAILAETDPEKQLQLRRSATLSDYYLGSVHAVTRAGQVVTASGSGSQLAAYAYSARHVIWVVGTQKIVPSLETALERVREYALPLEDSRMKSIGNGGSVLGKVLITEHERPGRVSLIFVNEPLGF